MRLKTLILLISIFTINYLSGQSANTYHQSFPFDKKIVSVIMDFEYPYQVEHWSGNTILVETNIRLDNASQVVLNYFKETGRYTVVTQTYPATIVFKMKDMIRKAIQTRKGACAENILLKVFIPEGVQVSSTGKRQL